MSRSAQRAAAVAAIVAIAAQNVAWAQATPGKAPQEKTTGEGAAKEKTQTFTAYKLEAKNDGEIFTFDYGIPTSPAMKLSGLSADNTTTSTSLKPFVLSLPSLFDDGESGQAIGLDFSILAVLSPDYTWGKYRELGDVSQALSRTRLGLVAYKGAKDADPSKSKASKLAMGLSASLLRASDPGLTGWKAADDSTHSTYWSRCVDAAMNDYKLPAPAPESARAKHDKVALQSFETEKLRQGLERAPDQAAYLRDHPEIYAIIGGQAATAAASPTPATSVGPGLTPKQIDTRLKEEVAKLDADVEELNKKGNEEALKDAKEKGFYQASAACAKKATAQAAASPTLDFGFGALWNGEPGKFSKFDGGGSALWIGGKYPLLLQYEAKKQADPNADPSPPIRAWTIGGSARYAWKEDVNTGDKATPSFSADTLDLWAGLEALSEKSKFALQYGRFKADARDPLLEPLSRSGDRWLTTAALRLSDARNGIWANLTYGVASGTTTTLDDKTILLTFSFGPVDGPNLFGGD